LEAPLLSTAAEHCKSLEVVLVSGCYLLKDAEVEALAKGCGSLRHLSLRECNQLRDQSLLALAACASSHLSHLDICWTGMRTSLVALADSAAAESLQSLHLSWCQLMDENSLTYSVSRFSQITDLNLSWRTISDGSFGVMLSNLPELESLDISGCSELTPAAFEFFKGRPGNTSLKELHMAWCRGLTDDGLTAIASECSNLTSLDVAICSKLTEASLREVGLRSTNLRRLILSRCAFSDALLCIG
jgi:hypothetical protein